MDREIETFLFAGAPIQKEDATANDQARSDRLNIFATKIGYLYSSVVGGKIDPSEADQRVKDLYKEWKTSVKKLKKES